MSSDDQNWVLGITLGLLGSIAINTGNNIQAMGLKSLQFEDKPADSTAPARQRTLSLASLPSPSPAAGKIPRRHGSLPWISPARTAPSDSHSEGGVPEFVVVNVQKKSPLQSVTWIVGTVVFVSGSLLNFCSYAFAAQSMLASLESVQFVTNLIFGKVRLCLLRVKHKLFFNSTISLASMLTLYSCGFL